jgi:ABC-2 type transport system permease protein
MSRLVRTELLKQRTTPVFLIGLAAVPILTALVTIAVLSSAGHQGTEALGGRSLVEAMSAPASIVTAVALLLGIFGMAGEYRHQTITTTFLTTPRRRDVVAAKLVAHGMTGAAMALLAVVVTAAITTPWLHSAGVAVQLDGDVVRVAAGFLLSTALYGAIGVSVGALIRNQTGAAIVALVWLLTVEGLLADVMGSASVVRWLPAAAGAALVHSGKDALPGWAAALVFTTYVVAFAGLSTRFVVSRDVT